MGAVPAALITLLLSWFSADASTILGALLISLLLVVLLPVVMVVSAFVNAGIYHLLVMLLVRQAHSGFEATLRVVCYSSFWVVGAFLFVIPLLNFLTIPLLSLYVLFLYVVGIREVHGTTTGQAVVVVLAPIAVSIVLSVIVTLLAAVALSV